MQLRPLPKTILGELRFAWVSVRGVPVSGAIVATVPLTAEAQAVAGDGVWFGLRARCNHTGTDWHRTNLTMLIDRTGSGEWEIGNSWLASAYDGCVSYWKTYTVATTLGFEQQHGSIDSATSMKGGKKGRHARFAVVVESWTPMPLTLADVVIAPLGVGWASLPG